MPCIATVKQWKRDKPEFLAQYVLARQEQADYYSEECLRLATEATPETVHVARLQIDTRKWYAGKMHPRAYGDPKSEITVNNSVNNITISAERLSELQEARRVALEAMRIEVK